MQPALGAGVPGQLGGERWKNRPAEWQVAQVIRTRGKPGDRRARRPERGTAVGDDLLGAGDYLTDESPEALERFALVVIERREIARRRQRRSREEAQTVTAARTRREASDAQSCCPIYDLPPPDRIPTSGFTRFTRTSLSRGARIRTGDLLLPKQARYQAAPRPAMSRV